MLITRSGSSVLPHGHKRLPSIKIPCVCIEAAAVALEMQYMGAYPEVGTCPGHYGISKMRLIDFSVILLIEL